MHHQGVVNRVVAIAIVGLVLGMAHSAQAQLTLDTYSASQTADDGFYISRPNDLGHLRFSFALHWDYANNPLVLELNAGQADSEAARVVEHQLTQHFNFSLGLADRLVLWAGIDAVLVMEGDSFNDPNTGATVALADGTGLGDTRLGARVRLVGGNDELASLALQVTVSFPTANTANSGQNFTGDATVTALPELLFEMRPGIVRINASMGAKLREDFQLGQDSVSHSLQYALGLGLVPVDWLAILAEAYGTTPFDNPGDRESSPLELVAGPKFLFDNGLVLGAAGGLGFLRGFGSPDGRAVLMLGWALPEEEPEPEPEPEPYLVPVPGDADGDGIYDNEDACPQDPEDEDGFEDMDGCPDLDNDKDGLVDLQDDCPLEPEETDGYKDHDGCPDPDNDGDGLLDADDNCPNEAEDFDQFEDQDGCPDPDNDGDGVLDVNDACPLVPGIPEEQGCARVRIENDRIVILDRVEFASGKSRILPGSEPILEAVLDTLRANTKIRLIRIEGHTDSRGRDNTNLNLSRKRAGAVRTWLIERGLSEDRIEGYGCGETRPIEDNGTNQGRQANRRVEFHILDPHPGEVRSTQGCRPAR